MDEVECYLIRDKMWIILKAKLNEYRHSASSCTINGRIYVFGGKDEKDNFRHSLEWYDAGKQLKSL